ncbi:hypothetical protein [Rhizobium paknamense]|uniref:AraC family transcriptional regulator n=1 Tax=Rhizobium paknamense TaxID=1206817 RepID=A0ABU0IEP4_9HYPH|nr:hypothetical protein [Rhizobium paknamense]MDQ0456718.1 hypothetical protein [Rhizobium paknamense]
MKTASTVADKMSKWFKVGNPSTLVIKPLKDAEMTIIHVSRDYPEQDASVVIPAEDAFLIVLYLKDVEHSDIVLGMPPSAFRIYPEGSICLLNLARGAAISVRGRFEALAIHLPRNHLTELAEQTGEPRIDDLAVCRGRDDPTIRDIGAALLPLIGQHDVEESLVSHIALALNAHLAHCYGRSRRPH